MTSIVTGFFFLTGLDKILLAPSIVKTTKFSLHGFLTRLKSCFHDMLKKLELRTETETFFCTKKEMCKTTIQASAGRAENL